MSRGAYVVPSGEKIPLKVGGWVERNVMDPRANIRELLDECERVGSPSSGKKGVAPCHMQELHPTRQQTH